MWETKSPIASVFMAEVGTEKQTKLLFFTWSSRLSHLCSVIREHFKHGCWYEYIHANKIKSRKIYKFWHHAARADLPTPTLRILLKSSLSTLKKWQLSSRKTIDAALGASFTSASLPKSSPSCRVHTTPCTEQNIYMQKPIITVDSIEKPYTNTGLYNQIPKQMYLAGNQQPK